MDGVVLVAAGASRRFGGRMPKVLRRLGGKPLLVRALSPFRIALERMALVVVGRRADFAALRRLLPRVPLVEGGTTRAQSVRRGVEALPDTLDVILVHDAARPLASVGLVRRVLEAARRDGAAVPVVRVVDSVHRIAPARPGRPAHVAETVDRRHLVAAQTPQGARAALLREAFAAVEDPDEDTDEASLLVRAGVPVTVVQGEVRNLKITLPEDLVTAERILESQG